jgi:hypothetical protein
MLSVCYGMSYTQRWIPMGKMPGTAELTVVNPKIGISFKRTKIRRPLSLRLVVVHDFT